MLFIHGKTAEPAGLSSRPVRSVRICAFSGAGTTVRRKRRWCVYRGRAIRCGPPARRPKRAKRRFDPSRCPHVCMLPVCRSSMMFDGCLPNPPKKRSRWICARAGVVDGRRVSRRQTQMAQAPHCETPSWRPLHWSSLQCARWCLRNVRV